jgi:hypothetical protein
MEIQNVLIFTAFVLSVGYLIYIVKQNFKHKGKCTTCSSAACNRIDFEQIEKNIKAFNK